jgi:hypothetical protein
MIVAIVENAIAGRDVDAVVGRVKKVERRVNAINGRRRRCECNGVFSGINTNNMVEHTLGGRVFG